MPDPFAWLAWRSPLPWTLIIVVLSWAIGRLAAVAVVTRVPRWVPDRQRDAAAAAVAILRRRIQWWSALAGLWVAAGLWPLTPEWRLLLDRGVFVLVGLSATLALAALGSLVVTTYGAALAPALPVSSLTRNIVWGAVVTLGGLVVLNGLGLSITPMLTALGVGGLAVALALQEPLGNLFAGLFITLAGQLRVGDYLTLDTGQERYLADFSWRSARLRMLSNNLVVVPNSKLAQAIVVNHHLPSADLAVLVDVGVDYASDLAHVERVVGEVGREVMIEVAGGIREFEPFVRFHTFGDSAILFTVILRAREFTDQYLVKHEFIKRLHVRFDREGIAIPFPIRTIARRGPAAATRDK